MTTLKEAMELKKNIKEIDDKIEEIARSNNVADLEKQKKALQSQYTAILESLYVDGKTRDGTLQIVNRGRTYRNINIEKLRSADKDIYELVSNKAQLSIKDFLEITKDYPKESMDELLTAISETTEYPKFEVIDLMEGD